MKRVLNSGSIKLPYITGSEKERLDNASPDCGTKDPDMLITYMFQIDSLKHVKFTFEIRAPLLVFVEGFQRSKLGTLTLLDGQDHQIGYLPQQYFDVTSTIMDAKDCNDYNTKLNNFYNWAFNFYNKLIEGGMCASQAALVLPQGVFKTFLFEINCKDLISFIEQNVNKSPEMAGYTSTLVLYMEDQLPLVTAYLKRNQWKDLV